MNDLFYLLSHSHVYAYVITFACVPQRGLYCARLIGFFMIWCTLLLHFLFYSLHNNADRDLAFIQRLVGCEPGLVVAQHH